MRRAAAQSLQARRSTGSYLFSLDGARCQQSRPAPNRRPRHRRPRWYARRVHARDRHETLIRGVRAFQDEGCRRRRPADETGPGDSATIELGRAAVARVVSSFSHVPLRGRAQENRNASHFRGSVTALPMAEFQRGGSRRTAASSGRRTSSSGAGTSGSIGSTPRARH